MRDPPILSIQSSNTGHSTTTVNYSTFATPLSRSPDPLSPGITFSVSTSNYGQWNVWVKQLAWLYVPGRRRWEWI